MNKTEAQQIISKTFEATFNKEQFTYFIKNLLNFINETKTFSVNSDMFKSVIKSYERIATYTDSDDKKIDILIVNLQKNHSLDYARTTQRNFAGDYLKNRGEKDAGLFAFVSPDKKEWRFSLVTIDYQFKETEKGIKAKAFFTPAKRYSFLMGENEASHTAQSSLIEILANDKSAPCLADLEQAFNIEKVTEEFFSKYRELFLQVKEALDKIAEQSPNIKAEFDKKNVDTVNFAKKLLGQIIFLYFLQKKGWFGVKQGEKWGTGSKRFLRELFDKKHSGYDNFFNEILEPLFYEAIRTDRSHDDHYCRLFDCKIPFLNGGLFDPICNYDWVNTDINLPNSLFSNKIENNQGNGILDIFDLYNFTVQEDQSLEKEVAIDPELLGKTYEKFNAIRQDNFYEFQQALKSGKKGDENRFNKKFGVYYTPREIVQYMCRQSLINYIHAEADKAKLNPPLKKEDIKTLIEKGEFILENEAIAVEKKEKIKTGKQKTASYKSELSQAILDNAQTIDEFLQNIKVCDPAVGSGAFPVGMMNEIVVARKVLSKIIKSNINNYKLKRQCIERSLYGADIDSGAVEIAKLRLWLSLIVDEQDIKNIKPLPNLDYKIVCGNSLMGLTKNLFNQKLFEEMEQLKDKLFNETHPNKKEEYKKQINNLIRQISGDYKEFDFKLYFSEVFREKNGFDIVIGNPPYISYGLRGGQKITKKEKEFLRNKFPNSAEYKISLYAIFMDKAIQLSNNLGIQSFITPDSFLIGRYFSKVRRFILRENHIIEFLLLPYNVFNATVGFSLIYFFKKDNIKNKSHKITAKIAFCNDDIDRNHFKQFSYPQEYFNRLKYNRFRMFFDQETMFLINKMEDKSEELRFFFKGRTGVRSKIGQKNIIGTEKKSNTWQQGLISSSQILKYKVIYNGDFINIDPLKLNKGGWDYNVIHNPKLLLRQTGDRLTAAIDYDGYYHLNNVHSFAPSNSILDILYILAIINSKLMNYYYQTITLETGRTMAQTDIETLESLPIKKLKQDAQEPFINLTNKILAITKDSDYLENPAKQAQVKEYEKKIDNMIYKLYRLTNEEIKIVELKGKQPK